MDKDPTDDPSRADRVVDALIDRLLRTGIDGVGRLDSARKVAAEALRSEGSAERAIDAIVSSHTKLAATGGFVTGLGGFVTLPVALPANVVGFYIVATRMVASIAAVQGHDVTKDEVRTAVLLSLSGDDATEILRKAGGGVITGRATSLALDRLPPAALMAVNKGVAFRIVVQLGEKGLGRLGRMVPLAGGFIGGGIDAYFMNRLAKHARKEFPPTGTALITSA
jgi:hypothetical protein